LLELPDEALNVVEIAEAGVAVHHYRDGCPVSEVPEDGGLPGSGQKGIDTFTLQHGEVGPLYVPVESDKIFVWGEMAKKEFTYKGKAADELKMLSAEDLLNRDFKDKEKPEKGLYRRGKKGFALHYLYGIDFFTICHRDTMGSIRFLLRKSTL
jgi:hypothetical protein